MKSLVYLSLLASYVIASPVAKRDPAFNDVAILNYALTLEHLEKAFYAQGIANFTQADFITAGYPDPFYSNLVEIAEDEATHVEFLKLALLGANAPAVAACQYSFPVTNVQSFVAVSSVLEGVGTSAYLGAAALIANKDYLTAAGGILTIEARHSAYIRASLNQSPFPQAFDDPLTANEVYSLAAPFIVSCPSTNPPLPVKAYPRLALATTGRVKSGDTIVLSTPGYALAPPSGSGATLYAAFITLTGPLIVETVKVSNGYAVVVPVGVNGQVYAVLTSCAETVSDAVIAAGPAIIEVTN